MLVDVLGTCNLCFSHSMHLGLILLLLSFWFFQFFVRARLITGWVEQLRPSLPKAGDIDRTAPAWWLPGAVGCNLFQAAFTALVSATPSACSYSPELPAALAGETRQVGPEGFVDDSLPQDLQADAARCRKRTSSRLHRCMRAWLIRSWIARGRRCQQRLLGPPGSGAGGAFTHWCDLCFSALLTWRAWCATFAVAIPRITHLSWTKSA